MSWNTLFNYHANSTGIGDSLHYIISRVVFSWNASNREKAIFQNLLDEVHDERLALSYTYARINGEERDNYIHENDVTNAVNKYSSQENIWGVTNQSALTRYKDEFIEEEKRWAMMGLTQTEIDKRRIVQKDIDKKIALSTPVLHRVPLFEEADIVVYDKIYGYYTIQLQAPYWPAWEYPIFRWMYKGDVNNIASLFKTMAEYKDIYRLHECYLMQQRELRQKELRQQEYLRETAKDRQQLENFHSSINNYSILAAGNGEYDSSNKENQSGTISHKKRQQTLDHVRAAMGQSANVNSELLDDSIF